MLLLVWVHALKACHHPGNVHIPIVTRCFFSPFERLGTRQPGAFFEGHLQCLRGNGLIRLLPYYCSSWDSCHISVRSKGHSGSFWLTFFMKYPFFCVA